MNAERFSDAVIQAALTYRGRGWIPIRVAWREKIPTAKNWQHLRTSEAEITRAFAGRCNVGVLLGEPSGGLVDVDLDCPIARRLAPRFLPSTCTFGRASNPISHYLFHSPGAGTFKCADPTGNAGAKAMIVELRSTGAQTVFPPSVHQSGEPIAFDRAVAEVASVEARDLAERVRRLAAAALLARHGFTDDAACKAVESPEPVLGEGLDRPVAAAVRDWIKVWKPRPPSTPITLPAVSDAERRRGEAYARAALEGEAEAIARSGEGQRHTAVFRAGARVGELSDFLDTAAAVDRLTDAANAAGMHGREREVERTLRDGIDKGRKQPRALPPPCEATATDQRANGAGERASVAAAPAIAPLLKRFADMEPEKLEWLWQWRIPRGKVTIIEGDPDLGKSTIALDLAARVTTGRPMPGCDDHNAPAAAILIGAEDGLRDTAVPRFIAASGDRNRMFALANVPDQGGPRPLRLPGDAAVVESAIRSTGASVVIIEALGHLLASGLSINNEQHVRSALTPLRDIAERTGAVIIVIRHLNKMAGGSALYRGSGSIALTGVARSVLAVGKCPDDPETFALATTKNNLAPRSERKALRYQLQSSATDPGAAVVAWGELCDLSADDLLAAIGPPTSQRHTAEAFLRKLLARGPVAAEEVERLAREQGIAKRTLDRAKQALSVASRKATDGWLWELPVAAPEPT